jgi:hypothetical protein
MERCSAEQCVRVRCVRAPCRACAVSCVCRCGLDGGKAGGRARQKGRPPRAKVGERPAGGVRWRRALASATVETVMRPRRPPVCRSASST